MCVNMHVHRNCNIYKTVIDYCSWKNKSVFYENAVPYVFFLVLAAFLYFSSVSENNLNPARKCGL